MNKTRRFFLTYLATAVLGSVVVFFGAPLVRGSIPTERLADMTRACRSDAPLSGIFLAMVSTRPASADASGNGTPTPGQLGIPRFRVVGSPSARTNAPAQFAARPQVPAPLPQPPAANGNGNGNVPAPPSYNYSSMWAIVSRDSAPVYDANGYLAQELAPGTLVEVAAVRTNQADRLAICRYNTQPKGMEIAIVPARFLTVRKGSLDAANADLLSLVMKQVQLEKEIRELRSASANELAKQNPHTEEYTSATKTCLSFNERLKSLKAKAESSQGTARYEAHDKLRYMKEEGVQLTKRYESAKRAYDKWNDEHSGVTKETESLKTLQQQLADVRKKIDNFDAQ